MEDIDLWKPLSDYVRKTCYGRDVSHGYEHMKQVALNALVIWSYMDLYIPPKNKISNQETFRNVLITVAWLHDVADHKYDKDGMLRNSVKEFLTSILPNYVDNIMNAIDYISFSKQKQTEDISGKINWDTLLGEEFALIRNIASDADKIEALGYNGAIRCMQYGYETLEHNTKENVINHLKHHAEYKLFKLYDEYILTSGGKKLAEPAHREFCYVMGDDSLLDELYETYVSYKRNL